MRATLPARVAVLLLPLGDAVKLVQVYAGYPAAGHLKRHGLGEHDRVRDGERVVQPFSVLSRGETLDVGRLIRLWCGAFVEEGMIDMTGVDDQVAALSAEAVGGHTLYRCLDKLAGHKRAFFSFLRARWERLFDARFEVLLYDLTSTYFESDPTFSDKRRFGCSREKRSDCVQVVIALIVTPEGFPLAYEVMPGNTSDKTTLAAFLKKIEAQYGRSDRVWIMDRGIPTGETLEARRTAPAPVHYLVGTPKGRLTKLENAFVGKPWRQVRDSVQVKLLSEDGELYVLAQSRARVLKERGMRRRRLKKLWRRLHELRGQSLKRDQLLLKLGAAKKEAGRAWNLVDIGLPKAREAVTAETFTFSLRRERLRQARRREGRYLLRSNPAGEDPATLWR